MSVVDEILTREGWPKFTDDPVDKGGPTRGGITLPALSAYLGRPATVAELQALDERVARAIYETNYIVRPGFMRIADAKVRDYLIDIAVTSGPARAIRYLQRILGETDDGVLGPVTAQAANKGDPTGLLNRLIAMRCRKLASDVQDHPEQARFIEGWIARAVGPLEG